jgi:16S rRNA processing protein RimM
MAETDSDNEPRDRVVIGEFGVCHGVSGGIKVRCHTVDPATVTKLGPVMTDDGTCYVIRQIGTWRGGIIASVSGIRHRHQAMALQGLRFYVPREKLPETAEGDEIYQIDLIGCKAIIQGRTDFVTIVGFHNFGAGDIMEVQPNWSKATAMVPFHRDFVSEVNVDEKRVVIQNAPGLFDDLIDEDSQTKPQRERRRRKARTKNVNAKTNCMVRFEPLREMATGTID